MDDHHQQDARVVLAEKYIALGWWLVPIRGPGSAKPKAPIYQGYFEFQPDADALAEMLVTAAQIAQH